MGILLADFMRYVYLPRTLEFVLIVIQCADVQFSADVTYSEPSSCKNNTNVRASAFPSAAAQRNANESTPEGQPQMGSGAGSATSTGAAVPLQTAVWGMLGVAFAGGMAVL